MLCAHPRRRFAALTLLTALLLRPGTSRSQESALAISSYTARVLASAPAVISAQDAFDAADAAYKAQVSALLLPTLSFNAESYPYGHNQLGSYEFRTWQINQVNTAANTRLDLNLFNSFQDYQKLRVLASTRSQAERALAAAKQNQAYAAVQAFYGLDSSNDLLEVAQQNLKAEHDQYVQSLDLYNNGMKSLADLLKSETDWRSSELRLVGAESDQKNALVAFNVLIDRKGLEPAVLSAVLEPGATALPLLDGDTTRALAHRPEIAQARAAVDGAKVAYQQAVQGLLPTFRVDAAYNRADWAAASPAGIPSGIPNPYYNLGLFLSLPLGFNGGSQYYAVAQAKAQRKSAESSLAATVRTVETDMAGAYVALELAFKSYTISLVKEDIARRTLDLVSNQYRQGSADAIRMNQAQNDYLDARVQSVLTLHNIFIDRAQYKRAAGDPLW
ncbi:MAG: TolC family protein [Elusimicrobiota bacterium]